MPNQSEVEILLVNLFTVKPEDHRRLDGDRVVAIAC
jgi:hypothetical protein